MDRISIVCGLFENAVKGLLGRDADFNNVECGVFLHYYPRDDKEVKIFELKCDKIKDWLKYFKVKGCKCVYLKPPISDKYDFYLDRKDMGLIKSNFIDKGLLMIWAPSFRTVL